MSVRLVDFVTDDRHRTVCLQSAALPTGWSSVVVSLQPPFSLPPPPGGEITRTDDRHAAMLRAWILGFGSSIWVSGIPPFYKMPRALAISIARRKRMGVLDRGEREDRVLGSATTQSPVRTPPSSRQ